MRVRSGAVKRQSKAGHRGRPFRAGRCIALLLALTALLGSGCGLAKYNVEVAKIGLVAPLSGPGAAQGGRWVTEARRVVAA